MDSTFVRTLTVVGIVGNGLLAGVFFAFSTFVMDGLRRAPAPVGIAAMQSINRQAPTPAFMLVFGGATAVSVVLGVVSIVRWSTASTSTGSTTTAILVLIACVVAVIPFLLTGTYHQPRNLALDKVDPTSTGAPAQWVAYASGWVRWNHVRTLASSAATALLALSLWKR